MSESDELSCDDPLLVDQAREGNQSAFTRLVECNRAKLFASLYRFLGCQSDAEEAVQEAFIKAFMRLDSFSHGSKFSTWLYRIAFNAAISEKRKNRPNVSLDQLRDDHAMEIRDAEEVDVALLKNEQIELVHQALEKLSDDHRAILVLREMDDLAYEEIASVLNVSVGTVRSRLARARGRLREAVLALQHYVKA